jgi:hypothetical protein
MKTRRSLSLLFLCSCLLAPFLIGADGGEGCAGGDVKIGENDAPAGGILCGDSTCGPGEYCCNESCSICAPEGGACVRMLCQPGETACGESTCGAGEYCCDPSCGTCALEGEPCPAQACEPKGEPCGLNYCGEGELCCNPDCGICVPIGGEACGDSWCGESEECCGEQCLPCAPGPCVLIECSDR